MGKWTARTLNNTIITKLEKNIGHMGVSYELIRNT